MFASQIHYNAASKSISVQDDDGQDGEHGGKQAGDAQGERGRRGASFPLREWRVEMQGCLPGEAGSRFRERKQFQGGEHLILNKMREGQELTLD